MPRYTELVKTMTVKDFKLRYRNSVLGFLWSLLNPLAMMVILTLVFSTLLRGGIENFPVFLLPALLVWRFFSIGTSMALWSIIGNASLVTKVYFPRWLLVLSSNLANLVGSTLEFLALLPLLFAFGMKVSWLAAFLPAVLAIEFVFIAGASLPLAALNVYYRDINQIWEIALQAGFFLCPIIYSASLVPSSYALFYSLNPMTRIIESVRKIFYYGTLPAAYDLLTPLLGGLVLMVFGYAIFVKLEPRFAEEI